MDQDVGEARIVDALRARDFRWLSVGLLMSNLGAQISFVTVATHLFDLSRSTAVVGLVGLVTLVPMLGIGLVGGVMADRTGRRRIVLGSQAVAAAAAFVVAAVVATAGGHVVPVLVFAATWAATIALGSPARISLIPVLVPASRLAGANAVLTLIMTLTWVAGPLLAATLVTFGGYAIAYASDGLLGLVALLAFHRVREPHGVHSRAGRGRLRDGARVVRSSPSVLLAVTLDAIAMVLCSPRVLFPAAAAAAFLGGGPPTVGLLFASMAVGGAVGAVLPAARAVGKPERSLLVMTVTWGAAVVAFGVVLSGPSMLTSVAMSLVALTALAVAGAADARATVVRQTVIQSHVHAEHMGRIQGIVFVVGVAAPRLGDMLMGSAADLVTTPRAAQLGGTACVAAAALAYRLLAGRTPADEATEEAQGGAPVR